MKEQLSINRITIWRRDLPLVSQDFVVAVEETYTNLNFLTDPLQLCCNLVAYFLGEKKGMKHSKTDVKLFLYNIITTFVCRWSYMELK